jgi:hypothetical protein
MPEELIESEPFPERVCGPLIFNTFPIYKRKKIFLKWADFILK